jgi:hypothetical protein
VDARGGVRNNGDGTVTVTGQIFFEIKGLNPKKVGFLDWIWMGNPKPKQNPKIQNPNPKKIQKSKPKKYPNPIFFLLFKIDIQLI